MNGSRAATESEIAAATEQARILAHALPYMRRYAGATVVVKYGGHAMGEEALAEQFGSDYARLRDFKSVVLKQLRDVLTVYPGANVSVTEGGLLLSPSPTAIPRRNS